MKQWLKDYFAFDKKQRNGALVLVSLIVIALGATAIINWKATQTTFDSQVFVTQEPVDSVIENPGVGATSVPDEEHITESGLFKFDPNTLDIKGWVKLGLTEKQAQVIINYRNAGKVFRKKEDLKKAYSIDAEMYAWLEPFIHIKRPGFPVELNTADSSQLVKIHGIGPATAVEIITYRKKLGGFHSATQLMDLKGITKNRFKEMESECVADPKHIKKLNINAASVSDLNAHPYCNYSSAKVIVRHRSESGSFNTVAEIKDKGLVNDNLYRKLAPYLSTE